MHENILYPQNNLRLKNYLIVFFRHQRVYVQLEPPSKLKDVDIEKARENSLKVILSEDYGSYLRQSATS